MRIWHEKLIPKLCKKHLLACWREGLGCLNILLFNKKGYSNHPQVKQYEHDILALLWILCYVRQVMLAREYHPKEILDSDEKWEAYIKLRMEQMYKRLEIPWQTLEEQTEILRNKNCDCEV